MTHIQLVKTFEAAWEDLWALVQQNPFILIKREENILVYFGHLLLDKLCPSLPSSSSGWRIAFDVAGAQRGLEWDREHADVGWRTRCDVVIRPEHGDTLEGEDRRGILAEIKILRCGIREYGDAENGEKSKRFMRPSTQLQQWGADDKRLRDLTSNDDGKRFKGAMCTLCFCRPPKREDKVCEVFPVVSAWNAWELQQTCAFGRSLHWIDGLPSNGLL